MARGAQNKRAPSELCSGEGIVNVEGIERVSRNRWAGSLVDGCKEEGMMVLCIPNGIQNKDVKNGGLRLE